LAATIDAKTGLEIKYPKAPNRFISVPRDGEGDVGTVSATTQFLKPPKRFGKLTSVAGSFANISINLEGRLTSWGRGIDCTVQYPDAKDTRIPKYAMKITFWASGMEAHVEGGGDWTELPGVRTVLSTSASGCILVNDVELRKESPSGDAAL